MCYFDVYLFILITVNDVSLWDFNHCLADDIIRAIYIYLILAAKISRNNKFAAFCGVFLTKMKLDPESCCNYFSVRWFKMKKIPKDNFI